MKLVTTHAANVVALLAFGIGVRLPAHAEIVDLKWDAGAFAHQSQVAPKKFLEVCGKLSKGEHINWQFKADGKTDFNVHYHVGKDVVYPTQKKGVASAKGTLKAPLDQDFCWMWTNKTDKTVAVEVKLTQAPVAK